MPAPELARRIRATHTRAVAISRAENTGPAPGGEVGLRRRLARHWGLLWLLVIATFFEGFDTKLAGVVQPLLGREFDAGPEELGLVLGLSSVGMVLAFFVIHLADWVGRRPVFLAALGAYSLLTLATAAAPSLVVYTALQLLARMAMVVELSLAYIILAEELPAETRGRAAGILGACAAFGAAVPPSLVLPLESLGIGWRGLFLVGALPALLLPIYVVRLRETRAFEARAAERGRFDPSGEWRLLRGLFSRARASRLAGITALWFTVNFWSGTALGLVFLYVYEERGWGAADIAWLPLGTIPFALAGYLLSGQAMDRLGRRKAAAIYLGASFVATACCFQSESKPAIYAAWFGMIAALGLWTIANTWTTELFPTELRATALGVTANLLGRLGMVVGPIVAGQLAGHWGSIADAVTALSVLNLLCLPLVLGSLPETRGLELTPGATDPEAPADQLVGI